ncbi:MAG: hypothetical protein QM533_11785 [Cytophagales bacterium]|nr:hypothetical protein [Cytophagales bacterium]
MLRQKAKAFSQTCRTCHLSRSGCIATTVCLATAHKERSSSDFKARLQNVVIDICTKLHIPVLHDAVLPIGGDLVADHLM